MTSIIVYTDGSYSKNKNGEKAGYGIVFPNGEVPNISRAFIHFPLTNQRAELYAIYKAIYYVILNIKNIKYINIYSDSEYSVNVFEKWYYRWKNNGWKGKNNKPLKNLDIIKNIGNLIQKHQSINGNVVKIIHVLRDTSKYNTMADTLAKLGSNKN